MRTDDDIRMDILPGGIREASDRLGISYRSGYRVAMAGELPVVRLGGHWVIPLAGWQRFLAGDWHPGSNAEEKVD